MTNSASNQFENVFLMRWVHKDRGTMFLKSIGDQNLTSKYDCQRSFRTVSATAAAAAQLDIKPNIPKLQLGLCALMQNVLASTGASVSSSCFSSSYASAFPPYLTTLSPCQLLNKTLPTVPSFGSVGTGERCDYSISIFVCVLLVRMADSRVHHWQSYRELHKKILAHEAPQRYVTWRCEPKLSRFKYEAAWCGGLRDRTRGMVNAFIYALLNDRAFLMNSKVCLLFIIRHPL
jgi:hypothetical protein